MVKIHACVNDCMLFYTKNQHLLECLTCKSPRYIAEGTGKKTIGTPVKALRYLPIIPRLQRLFISRKSVEYMSWHNMSNFTPGIMTYPARGEAWKHFDDTFLDFSSDSRNVGLGLCADDFSPFGYSSKSYSIWPVVLTVYNLPPWLCMIKPFMFLTLLILGLEVLDKILISIFIH